MGQEQVEQKTFDFELGYVTAPYVAHSVTSKAAAKAIVPEASTQRGRVLQYLRTYGPATDEEMQRDLNMNPSTQRPRRIELIGLGLVFDSGQYKNTKSGRKAVLWKAHPAS